MSIFPLSVLTLARPGSLQWLDRYRTLDNYAAKEHTHTPWWAIKKEREEEASHPGPPTDGSDIIDIETSNITSGNTNKETALARKAAIQFLQEAGMNKGQRVYMAANAIESNKRFIGGPTDPALAKAAAGVGALIREGLNLYPVPNPTDDYRDAEATGRCMILCVDLGGTTLVCANVYGWTGGLKGSMEAARTDDIITIARMQIEKMPKGPKDDLW